MSQRLMRLGMAAFALLLTLIVSVPGRGQAQPTGSIEALDQKIVDGTIVVKLASISQDGWIVVRKAGPDGKMQVSGEIGKVRIRAGDNADVVVPLSEAVADGAPLWPMLHIDAGDIGVFEFPGGPDTPVVASVMPVMARITVLGTETSAPPAPSSPPDNLPTTSGEGLPFGLVGFALALIVAGRMVVARSDEGLCPVAVGGHVRGA